MKDDMSFKRVRFIEDTWVAEFWDPSREIWVFSNVGETEEAASFWFDFINPHPNIDNRASD